MKSLHILSSAALFACCLSSPALRAQTSKPPGDAPAGKPGDVPISAAPVAAWIQPVVILEMYALDLADAHSVLEGKQGNAAGYLRVLELEKNGKARLETLTAVSAKSGQRAVSESIDEVRYPTEFSPGSTRNATAAPTAWEMRNAGDVLEIEMTVGPGNRSIDANIIPQRIGLVEFRDIGGMAGDIAISQPVFRSQKLQTSTSLAPNVPHMLGTFSPGTPPAPAHGDASREVWLAFLRVSIASPSPQQLQPRGTPGGSAAMHLDYSFFSLERTDARAVASAQPGLDEPWQKLQPLLHDQKARLERIVSVTTKSGQRAVAEETREDRFATEYEVSGKAASVESSRRTSTTRPVSGTDEKSKAADEAKATQSEETSTITRVDVNAEATPGYPTAFEMRNIGVAVELEPVMGPDGHTIELNHVVSLTTALGNLQTTGVAVRYPAQPLIETRRITTSQTLLAGSHQLVGTFNPPGANGVNDRKDTGRAWLVFVRATPDEP